MKLKLTFTILLLAFSFFSYSQSNDSLQNTKQSRKNSKDPKQTNRVTKIKINLKEKSIGEIPTRIKRGDYYQIVIDSINLNLWKVTIKSKDTTITNKLETPTYASAKFDELSPIVSSLTSITSSGFKKRLVKVKKEDLIIEEDFEKTEAKQFEFLSEQNSLKQDIDNMKFEVIKKEYYYLDSNDRITDSPIRLDEVLLNIDKYKSDIITLKVNIENNRKNYLDVFYENNKDKIKIVEAYVEMDKKLKANYDKLLTNVKELLESINSENSAKLLKSILFLEEKSTSYESMPIQFNEEKAVTQIVIEPRKEEYNLQQYEIPLIFPVDSFKYWSVGVSFFGSNLYDERYSSKSFAVNDSVRNYELVKEDKQKHEIGISAMIRFGTKFEKKDGSVTNFGIHGTLGPGITIEEKIKPRLLLGGGFTIGDKHNFALDFGGILGYVERLSNAYSSSNNNFLDIKPENVTISKLDIGFFLSLGYLFNL